MFLLDLRWTQSTRWTTTALASPSGPFAVWRKSGGRMPVAITLIAPRRFRRPPRTSQMSDGLGADRESAGTGCAGPRLVFHVSVSAEGARRVSGRSIASRRPGIGSMREQTLITPARRSLRFDLAWRLDAPRLFVASARGRPIVKLTPTVSKSVPSRRKDPACRSEGPVFLALLLASANAVYLRRARASCLDVYGPIGRPV
jgi:hypothetical protein